MNEPRYTSELDDILALCLDDVLRGKQTIDDCLQQYPEYAPDLELALSVAMMTVRLKSPEMAADRVDALESRLRAQMPAPRKIIQFPIAISRLAASVAIVLLLAFGSGAGLVAASSDSLPGDPLYGIKRLWEAIVLVIMGLTDQFDGFTLHLAEVRLDEVKALADLGRLDQTALIDLYSATAKAITNADSADEQDAVTDYLADATDVLESVEARADDVPVYRDVVTLMTPVVGSDGRLQPPISEIPPSLNAIATVTPTATPTLTATTTATSEPSLTPVATDTDAPLSTDAPSATNTPRIPPTPTRTPSPTPTITPSPTLTVTPTSSWTPLPIPTVPTLIAPSRLSPQPGGSNGRTPVPGGSDATAQMRETQQAVYLTQTAGPPQVTSTNTP